MGLPIDALSRAELDGYNARYKWLTGTRDSKGRVLGSRQTIFEIPDKKVQLAVQHIDFAGKGVVEFGCLEGAHTVALCRQAGFVTALEGRPLNLEKAILRCNLYGAQARFDCLDLENELPPSADVFFHSGVLYHLEDPVRHLLRILPLTSEIFLDTHYTRTPNDHYTCPEDGKRYAFWRYGEDAKHPKSGLGKYARWLVLPELLALLEARFFVVKVVRKEDERNGPRVSIVAKEPRL